MVNECADRRRTQRRSDIRGVDFSPRRIAVIEERLSWWSAAGTWSRSCLRKFCRTTKPLDDQSDLESQFRTRTGVVKCLPNVQSQSVPLISAMSITCMAAIERGIIIREGIIYVSPDASSAKLSNIGRGREVAIVERSPGWLNVVGTVETDPDRKPNAT